MSLIPDEELKREGSLNLAPLVDFLFLILEVFAVLAVTRTALFDKEVNLVQLKAEDDASKVSSWNPYYTINLSITEGGQYKWLFEDHECLMETLEAVSQELARQHQEGTLPQDKNETRVLLHIDKNAPWEPIAKAIFAVREAGFQIHPVYEPAN
jgi:biopolymer transport protein ExbD